MFNKQEKEQYIKIILKYSHISQSYEPDKKLTDEQTDLTKTIRHYSTPLRAS
jgi:hypothetical protein